MVRPGVDLQSDNRYILLAQQGTNCPPIIFYILPHMAAVKLYTFGWRRGQGGGNLKVSRIETDPSIRYILYPLRHAVARLSAPGGRPTSLLLTSSSAVVYILYSQVSA